MRGWSAFLYVLAALRGCPFTPANSSPPRRVGTSGNCVRSIIASTGLTEVRSKPRFSRLKRSLAGTLKSQRSPRFRLRRLVTRQSSCTQGAK